MKSKHTMKKLLLILSIFVVSLSAFAAELNPFAYGLYADVNTNPSGSPDCVMGLQWKLNATATRMKVIIIDESENEYVYRDYVGEAPDFISAGSYGTSVTHSKMAEIGVPYGEELKWRVDVEGESPNAPTLVEDKEYDLYSPRSIAIDKRPESKNFGRIMVTETVQGTVSSDYHSKLNGSIKAGLYAFDASFKNINDATSVYTGGNDFTRKDGLYQPWIVRISEDGRIFVSSMGGRSDGVVVWEVNPDQPNAAWTPIVKGYITDYTGQADATTGVYWVYSDPAKTKFLAGQNISMDVKGRDGDLKLLLYSMDRRGKSYSLEAYKLHEYSLGEADYFSGEPIEITAFTEDISGKSYGMRYNQSRVIYDGDYGYWFGASASLADEKYPNLAYVKKNANGTYTHDLNKVNDMTWYAGAGILLHKRPNGDEWLFKGYNPSKGTNSTNGKFNIFKVSRDAQGTPSINTNSPLYSVSHTVGLGYSHEDFAVDYAENLYVVGASGEKIVAFALPYDGLISTPAASEYAFTINCQSDAHYNVQVNTQNATYGTVEGGGDNIASCETTTVFAQSKDGYKFVCWKEGSTTVSTNNPYTFVVTKDMTLTAHFEEGDYNVTWWNLFKDGEDIAKESTTNPNTNERVWRWYQVEYNKYFNKTLSNTESLDNGHFNVLKFYSGDNIAIPTAEGFMESTDSPFRWLGKYIEYVVGGNDINKVGTNNVNYASYKENGYTYTVNVWGYQLYMFFNRSSICCNMTGTDVTTYVRGYFSELKDFTEAGKPEHWRPWWTEHTCGLPSIIGSQTRLPVVWEQEDCATGSVGTFTPSSWYQWNTISDPNNEYILAWRDGSKTGRIVHNVYRDNMELHVSYVKKHLEENDPIVKQPNEAGYDPDDASNNDVLQLLRNPNFGAIPQHKLTMTRNITAGMYNTICLPFELTTLVGTPYDGAQILQINTTTTEDEVLKINFTPLAVSDATPMKAGVPYLIQKPTDITGPQAFDGAKFPAIEAYETNYALNEHGGVSVDVGAITFHGVINPTDIPQGSIILVANNRLAEVTETGQMAGFRGYFTWNDPVRKAPSRMEITVGKQVPTDVEEIVENQITQPAAPKVRKVMYDGQIYILRGDEVYTITGHRVK
mgnify:CR=1 FL=1